MRILLIVALTLLALLLCGGWLLPAEVRVERSTLVGRPAATVFAVLDGFQAWREWSPWARLDPSAEFLVTGPERGVGARISWIGDPALLGSGWQEIVASVPNERITTRLELGTQGVAHSEFLVSGDALGSRVTWTYTVDVTEGQGLLGAWLGRYFGVFLDDWVAADFERGLVAFKSYAESLPSVDFAGQEIERLQMEPRPLLEVAGLRAESSTAVETRLREAFAAIGQVMAEHELTATGPPLAFTVCEAEQRCRHRAAVPVAPPVTRPPLMPPVRWGQLPDGMAVRLVHRGDPAELPRSYARLDAWMAAHGLRGTGLTWEEYVDDPRETPQAQLQTRIYAQLVPED
jgi:hypothetical protein